MRALLSLSRSATSAALDISEIALLVFGIVLVLGLVGEVAKSERWRKWLRIFELMVIIGVAGELVADGGIFLFSRHLQTITETEYADLNKQATDAYNQAEHARKEADSFELDIAKAKQGAADADERASKAEENLGSAKRDAAVANERAAEANKIAEGERLARLKLEKRLAPRTLNNDQQRRIESKIKPFSGTPYELAVDPVPEAINLLKTVDAILRSSGWTNKESAKTDFRFVITLPSGSKVEQGVFAGVVVKLTKTMLPKYEAAAGALIRALQAEGIDATAEILEETDPSPKALHVMIGSKE
jgi:hypothetical protein